MGCDVLCAFVAQNIMKPGCTRNWHVMGCNVVWRLQRNATNAGSLPPGRHLKTQDCLCGFKNEHLLTEVISHIFCVLSFHFSGFVAAAAWPLVKELPLSEVISACAKRCFLPKPGAGTILVSHIT